MRVKLILLSAVIALNAVALAGCVGEDETPISDITGTTTTTSTTYKNAESKYEETTNDESEETTGDKNEKETENDEVETTANNVEETPEDVGFIHSTHDESGRYICEFLGVGADFGEDWIFYSENDMLKYSGASGSSNADYKAVLDEKGYVTDMIVCSSSSGTSLLLNEIHLYYEAVDTESGIVLGGYVNAVLYYLKKQIGNDLVYNHPAVYTGSYILNAEQKLIDFAGNVTPCIDVTANMVTGKETHSRIIFLKKDDYIASFAIKSLEGKNYLDKVTAMFYAL